MQRITINIYSLILAVAAMAMPWADAMAFGTSAFAATSVLSSGRWVMVQVTDDGIYRISKSDISKWGFSNIENIRVFGYGGAPISDVLSETTYIDDLPQQPVVRNADGSILFYGKGPESWSTASRQNAPTYIQVQHPYATAGYYFVTENAEIADMEFATIGRTPSATGAVTTFTERSYYEKELTTPGMTGRLLLGDDFKYSTSQNFKFKLTGLVPGTTVYTATSFAAKVMTGSSRIALSYNGTPLAQTTTDNISAVTDAAHEHVKMTTTYKSFELSNEDLSLGITYSYSGTLYSANLNYITVNYTRELSLSGASLAFRGNGAACYRLSGGDATTMVLDVTAPSAPVAISATADGASMLFAPGNGGDREMIAFNPTATFPSPTMVQNVDNQDLHQQEVPDLVIITPSEFFSQAERVAEMHRSADSMRVLVVEPQKIYNEFSSGTPDINAYRRMLKMYYDRSQSATDGHRLGYVLLFGRASYDNRAITSTVKAQGFPKLLTWQSNNGEHESTSFNTDDILAFLDDNSGASLDSDRMRIAVGRMPVKSTSEAKQMVDKLLAYTSNTDNGIWKNSVLVIADDDDNGAHMSQSDLFISNFTANGGSSMKPTRLYIDSYESVSAGSGRSYPQAREDMFRLFKEGAIWVNYVGHASPVGWSHEGMLNITDINTRFYYKHLPLLYTATCEFTRWDSDDVSGGELLWLNRSGGAIALISTSRVAYITENGTLTGYVGSQVFRRDSDGRYQRIGDILKNAKNMFPGANENKLRYSVTGDPAMRLNLPTESINITAINGQSPDSADDIVLESGSQVTIEGNVSNAEGNIDSQFNGIITMRLYDAEESVTTHGNGDSGVEFTYDENLRTIYLGQDSVEGGRYSIKFRIPTDIANNYRPAMANMYAVSADGIEASGIDNNLYVYGFSDEESDDVEGPEITLLGLNSSSFTDGDVVNADPLVVAAFDDPSGINLSTSGIGHQMILVLDEAITYSDITNYYTPSIGTSGGSIAYPLSGLSDGVHTLRLRVWDTLNNSSEKTVTFSVKAGLKPEISNVYTSVNPASTDVNFYVQHNRPESSMNITIEVFDLMGRPVWSTSEAGTSDMYTSFPIYWDLCDTAGRRVGRGIYIYRATITADDGTRLTTKSKKLAVTAQ